MSRLIRLAILSSCLVGMAAGIALAQVREATGPFTLEQILSSPFPSELVAAPVGTRLAWVFNHKGHRNIWVAAGPNFSARQLTQFNQDDGQELGAIQFSGDGNVIVFVLGGNKNQAGEVPNPTSDPGGVEQAVWAAPLLGGPPRKIDAGNNPTVSPRGNWVAYVKDNKVWLAALDTAGKPKELVARGNNSSPIWSSDGRKLAFVSNRGTHSFIAVYEPATDSLRYVAPTVDRDTAPRWSPDGSAIAFVRAPARPSTPQEGTALTAPDQRNPWSIWVAELATGAAREIWRSSDTPEGSIPRMAGPALLNWAAEGRIVFASEQDGWQHLYSVPASGGTPTLLTPGECEFEQMTFTPDRRAIVYSSNCGDIDRRHLWRVSVTGGAPEAVTSGEGIEWAPAVTADGKWIAYFASDARRPAMPFVRSTDVSGAGRMLAANALPKDFPSDQLVAPQQVIIEAPDGLKIHNQLFLPGDLKPGEQRPAVIFMHGGPVRQMLLGFHNRGYYHRAYALNQYLASRGYIVLSVNYRSGIGYGRAFREAPNRGARGASEYQDIVTAGRYLAGRPDVDPKRIGLWGGSYGGYLTAMGLARDSDLFAAGVDLHGVHDWSMRQFGGGLGGERARVARQASPVADVDKWRSPVLLIHGDDDRNVDFVQTVDLAARLRQRNVRVEFMIYPDEVHDFLLYRHWIEIYRATANFFDRHLKSPAQAATGSQ